MGAIFAAVNRDLLLFEGSVYSSLPGDPGGGSKFGISQKEYPNVDIRNLTLAGALAIYQRDYWDKFQLSNINTQSIADKIFIALINMNPEEAVSTLQKAVNYCAGSALVDVDGDLGSQTFEAINATECQGWLHDRFGIELVLLYISKVEADKGDINFLVSWDRRAVVD